MTTASSPPPRPKPRLRGRIHLGAALLALPAMAILVLEAQAGTPTMGALTYGLSLILLLAVSGTYHTLYWPVETRARLQRLDRSMIFVLIAGSYTPFLIREGGTSVSVLLPLIWFLGMLGVVRIVFFPSAYRWMTVFTYVVMGWISVPLMPRWTQEFGVQVVGLIVIGGAIYTLGAVAYAKRWPNPWPFTFGYHEIFHVSVVLGSVCHYWAVWQVVI